MPDASEPMTEWDTMYERANANARAIEQLVTRSGENIFELGKRVLVNALFNIDNITSRPDPSVPVTAETPLIGAVSIAGLEERLQSVANLVSVLALVARQEGLEVEPRVLHDGCIGDAEGYQKLLTSQPHVVVDSSYGDYGYGHHSYNEIVVLADGRVLHAECGGCSCEGSGSWSFENSVELARRLIPEQERAA